MHLAFAAAERTEMQHNSSFVFYSTVMISVKFSSGRLHQHFQALDHKKKTHTTTNEQNKNNSQLPSHRLVLHLLLFFPNFSAALLNGGVPLFRCDADFSLAYTAPSTSRGEFLSAPLLSASLREPKPTPTPTPTALGCDRAQPFGSV